MNKSLLAVSVFPVEINGSVADPLENARELDIITKNSEYILSDEIKIELSFKNNLMRDIKIVNDNCNMPEFILEKKIEEKWERVYLSDSLGTPVRSISPTVLQSEKILCAEIYIYTPDIQDDEPVGEYRLCFNLLEKENNKRLPEKYLYSNVFNIKEKS